MVDFLLIGRLLAGAGWEEEVVEEVFLPVAGCHRHEMCSNKSTQLLTCVVEFALLVRIVS